MRLRALPPLALLLVVCAVAAPGAQSLRKIGEMELSLVGLNATLDSARPAIPKNVSSGVKINITAGGSAVAPGAVARLLGQFRVEGELSGPRADYEDNLGLERKRLNKGQTTLAITKSRFVRQ